MRSERQARWHRRRDCPPLEIISDGQLAGIIGFGPTPDPEAAAAIKELRLHGELTIGLLSDQADEIAGPLAAALGVDFHGAGLTSDAKLEMIQKLTRRGFKVAYVGDCRREQELAQHAHIAISLVDEFDPKLDTTSVLALRRDLGWLGQLREISRSHVDRVRAVHGAILLPNLVCIGGAFFLGFTSLSAVILTNLGTLAVYAGLPRRLRTPGQKGPAALNGRLTGKE